MTFFSHTFNSQYGLRVISKRWRTFFHPNSVPRLVHLEKLVSAKTNQLLDASRHQVDRDFVLVFDWG